MQQLRPHRYGGGHYSNLVDARAVGSLSAVLDATLLGANAPARPAPVKP
jgi:hypothetical protein